MGKGTVYEKSERTRCPGCGSPMSAGSYYCRNCGKRRELFEDLNERPGIDKKRIGGAIAAVVCLAALIGGVIFALNWAPSPPDSISTPAFSLTPASTPAISTPEPPQPVTPKPDTHTHESSTEAYPRFSEDTDPLGLVADGIFDTPIEEMTEGYEADEDYFVDELSDGVRYTFAFSYKTYGIYGEDMFLDVTAYDGSDTVDEFSYNFYYDGLDPIDVIDYMSSAFVDEFQADPILDFYNYDLGIAEEYMEPEDFADKLANDSHGDYIKTWITEDGTVLVQLVVSHYPEEDYELCYVSFYDLSA